MKTFRIMTAVCLLSALLFGCSADAPSSVSTGASSSREAPVGISRESEVSSGSVTPLPSYGVFIGAEPEDIGQMLPYDIVVIDAAYFTAEAISQLQSAGLHCILLSEHRFCRNLPGHLSGISGHDLGPV